MYLQMFAAKIEDTDTDEMKSLKLEMYKLRDLILNGKYEIVFNAAVDFLLSNLQEESKFAVLNLIRKNKKTDLWEKINDGIFYRVLPK